MAIANNPNTKRGDKMKVVKDSRAENETIGHIFGKHIGETGTVTYVDKELISLKFENESTSIAYWRSEVAKP